MPRRRQAFERDSLGVVAVVDHLDRMRAIRVGERGDVQAVCAIAGHGRSDSRCTFADKARAEVSVRPQTLRNTEGSRVVDEQEGLVILGNGLEAYRRAEAWVH